MPGLAAPREDGPVDVEIRVYLLDLARIDDVNQNYVASYFLEYRWQDSALAHGGDRPTSLAMGQVWTPRLQVINQQAVKASFPEVVEVSAEGQVVHRQRLWGTFSQPLDLREFPFDRQELSLQIAAIGWHDDEVELKPSADSGLSGNFSIVDWAIGDWRMDAKPYHVGGTGADIPSVTFRVAVERHAGHFVAKVIVPLVLIVMMAMVVFWIDPGLAGTQVGVSATSILTLIAYRFSVGASLPKLSFLTRLDYFILSSTLLVFTCLVMVVWTSSVAKRGDVEKANAIDRRARWIMPAVFLVLMAESLYFRVLM